MCVEQTKGHCRQRREFTHSRSNGCSATGGIGEGLPDEMLVCACSYRDDVARATGRLKRALARAAVTSGYGYNHSCLNSVVESVREQIVIAMIATAQ